ncbi:MAG TPA: hypothetical protein DIT25_03455 [Candidatus Moranbacteria bacterium]|nr:hypothetical protein [Candidatus Moranbacteria bacterium]
MKIEKFGDLAQAEEFIINPANLREDEEVIVFLKLSNSMANSGDINRSILKRFTDDDEVIAVRCKSLKAIIPRTYKGRT